MRATKTARESPCESVPCFCVSDAGSYGRPNTRVTADSFSAAHGGLRPAAQIDLLALQGDTADGIPGVPGAWLPSPLSLATNWSPAMHD